MAREGICGRFTTALMGALIGFMGRRPRIREDKDGVLERLFSSKRRMTFPTNWMSGSVVILRRSVKERIDYFTKNPCSPSKVLSTVLVRSIVDDFGRRACPLPADRERTAKGRPQHSKPGSVCHASTTSSRGDFLRSS